MVRVNHHKNLKYLVILKDKHKNLKVLYLIDKYDNY